jgi:hypothetical protein
MLKWNSLSAIGILTLTAPWSSVATVHASDDVCKGATYNEILCPAKQALDIGKEISSIYSGLKSAWDISNKIAQFIGWESKPLDLQGVQTNLENYMWAILNDMDWKESYAQISVDDDSATEVVEHLIDRESLYTDNDEDNSYKAAHNLANAESWNTVFARLYSTDDDPNRDPKSDKSMIEWLNQVCPASFPPTRVSNNTCDSHFYSWVDLHPAPGLTDSVYDWRLGLPSLMLFISYRLQFILSRHPDYLENPNAYPGILNELASYRTTLYKHYYYILSGMKCFGGTCYEIHSGYKTESATLVGYALFSALPLYELKSLIDVLYIYTHPPQSDLTQDYHRLPASTSPYLCLKAKKQDFDLSVSMDGCDGSSTQQWVYDRGTGWVRNTGTAANDTLASGECLGVTGYIQVQLGGEYIRSVHASPCSADDRGQRWTYDPEAHVLLNATGTSLSINWNASDYNVWAEPFAFKAYGPDPDTGLNQPDAWLVRACRSTDKNTKLPNKGRQDQCISQLPKGVPYAVKYRDSSTVTWQADQAGSGQIAPGVAAPFSDGMKPSAVMSKGQFRVSPNNKYELVLQMDGNLVLFKKDWGNSSSEKAVKLWSSYTAGKNVDRVVMEPNGNLVIYPSPIARQKCPDLQTCDNSIWQTRTNGNPQSHLKVQDNGQVVISYQPLNPPAVDGKGKLLYSTSTWWVPQTVVCGTACLLQ